MVIRNTVVMKQFGIIIFTFLSFFNQYVIAQNNDEVNIERKQMAEKMDKQGLLSKSEPEIIKTKQVLKIPETIKHLADRDFTVAHNEPVIEFMVVPIQQRYQINPPSEFLPTIWSNWGQGIFSESTQTYYFSYGNHRLNKAKIYIAAYDTKSKTIQTSPEINEAIGRNLPQGLGDGKIHGWLNFYGDEIFFCTYWGHYPEPLEEHYQLGYDGGHIVSYNVRTKKITDHGIPMQRASWPYHNIDPKRGLLFAVGAFGEFLCYDIDQKKTRYAGFPPNGIQWNKRAMLVDENSGMVYSTNTSKSNNDGNFINYDPISNRFGEMEIVEPSHRESGTKYQMRAHTKKKSKDGWFIGVSTQDASSAGGQLFKFYPEKKQIENLELCWPGELRYTTSLALGPNEKYLYYLPGAHGVSHLEGSPVVQYNVLTGERKVLAFLFPYLYQKYGYVPGGSFSIDIDSQGKRLFICMNGEFTDYKTVDHDIFGDPSVLVIHIPEEERK
jgi:hypothetical protein